MPDAPGTGDSHPGCWLVCTWRVRSPCTKTATAASSPGTTPSRRDDAGVDADDGEIAWDDAAQSAAPGRTPCWEIGKRLRSDADAHAGARIVDRPVENSDSRRTQGVAAAEEGAGRVETCSSCRARWRNDSRCSTRPAAAAVDSSCSDGDTGIVRCG